MDLELKSLKKNNQKTFDFCCTSERNFGNFN